MSRLVVVSFAFLGLGFYELSGGDEFSPPVRPAESNQAIAKAPSPALAEATTKFRQSAKMRATALVASNVLQDAPPQRPAPDRTHRQNVALSQIVSAGAQLQASETAFSANSQGGSLHLGSLQGGLASLTTQLGGDASTARVQTASLAGLGAAPAAPETYLDVRQIRASRVNMRQGPGTIYPVLSRLLAGDEVLVIDDNGDGWLQLRTKKGNKIGWVAASLVGKKRS